MRFNSILLKAWKFKEEKKWERTRYLAWIQLKSQFTFDGQPITKMVNPKQLFPLELDKFTVNTVKAPTKEQAGRAVKNMINRLKMGQPIITDFGANTKGFDSGMLSMFGKFNKFQAIAVATGAVLTKVFVDGVKDAAEFEKELSRLEAISGATGDEIGALERQAKKLGSTTASTAGDVVKLQTELAKLGFTSNEILNSTGGVRDLSDALEIDLGDAAKITGSTLRQFGLDATETGRVVDVLSDSTTKSALDFHRLEVGLPKVGAAANAVGLSLEETVALLGTLANSGIESSKAGTDLKRIFLELNKSGTSWNSALSQLNQSSDKLGTATQLVGERANVAFLQIAKYTQNTQELTKQLEMAEGASRKIAEIKLDNLAGDTTKLKSAWEAFSIELGEVFLPILRVIVQATTSLVNWLQRVVINFKKLGAGISLAFNNLAIDILEGIKAMREFAGLDTSVIDAQIVSLRDRVAELNDELAILNGNAPALGGPTKPVKTTSNNNNNNTTTATAAPSYAPLSGGFTGFRAGGLDGGAEDPTLGVSLINTTLTNQLPELNSKIEETQEQALSLNSVFLSLADSISQAFSGEITGKGLLSSLLSTLGDVAIQVGIASLTIGTTIEAIRTAIMSFLGVGAIAAGAILIGTGIALKAGAASLGGAASKANVASPIGTSGSTSGGTPQLTQDLGGSLRLVSEVRGKDLRLALEREMDSYQSSS